MTTEERLKEYIKEHYGTVREFCDKYGFPYSTVSTIFKRGISKASVTTIIKICQALNISTDELVQGNIVPVEKVIPDLMDLSRNYITMIDELPIKLNGEVLTKAERWSIRRSLEVAIDIIKASREEQKKTQVDYNTQLGIIETHKRTKL